MTSFDKLFGPLTKDYCKYFLALSVLGFIFMVFSMVSLIIVVLMNGKKQNYHIQTLLKICLALNCTPNDIIEKDMFMDTQIL